MSTNILYGKSAVTQNEIFNTFLLASVRDELGRPGRGKSVLDTLPFLNFAFHLFTLL